MRRPTGSSFIKQRRRIALLMTPTHADQTCVGRKSLAEVLERSGPHGQGQGQRPARFWQMAKRAFTSLWQGISPILPTTSLPRIPSAAPAGKKMGRMQYRSLILAGCALTRNYETNPRPARSSCVTRKNKGQVPTLPGRGPGSTVTSPFDPWCRDSTGRSRR